MTAVVPLPLSWAEQLIRNAYGPVPRYGSAEWLALPDDSRVKVAACVIAAESWRTYWAAEEHERRLRAELDASAEIEEEPRWTPEIVESVHRTATRPGFAELSRRRGEPAAERRADEQRRRLGLPVEREDAPEFHLDGRPVRYRAPLRAVPDAQ